LFFAGSVNHINIIINFRENKVFCSENKVVLWLGYDAYIILLSFVYAVEYIYKDMLSIHHLTISYPFAYIFFFFFFYFILILGYNLYIILYSKLIFFFF
jgi:hypothetical protein